MPDSRNTKYIFLSLLVALTPAPLLQQTQKLPVSVLDWRIKVGETSQQALFYQLHIVLMISESRPRPVCYHCVAAEGLYVKSMLPFRALWAMLFVYRLAVSAA